MFDGMISVETNKKGWFICFLIQYHGFSSSRNVCFFYKTPEEVGFLQCLTPSKQKQLRNNNSRLATFLFKPHNIQFSHWMFWLYLMYCLSFQLFTESICLHGQTPRFLSTASPFHQTEMFHILHLILNSFSPSSAQNVWYLWKVLGSLECKIIFRGFVFTHSLAEEL